MLFNTVQFLFFFLIVHFVFWHLPPNRRRIWLFISSIFFYGFWSVPFLVHFLLVVVINYIFAAILLHNKQKWILALALIINLVNLFFFKYTNSFLTYGYEWFGLKAALELKTGLGIILPLAISFYTFQIIAFLVDVYRGELKEVEFIRYATFILFFPQLIAGPIMRHRDFYYQMDEPRGSWEKTRDGLMLVVQGVIKKVLIADAISVLIDPVWADPSSYSYATIWLVMFAFSAQIYSDFSGYTDMARGQAKMLGYDIPENFYAPFFAASFAGIWRNWHVTLSTWLRDYLYIPLGGNRVAPWRMKFNLVVVMSLGGLWHGDTINFFLWGFALGVMMIVERYIGMGKKPTSWKTAIPRWALVHLGWITGAIFFRLHDFSDAVKAWSVILSLHDGQTLKEFGHVIQLTMAAYGFQLIRLVIDAGRSEEEEKGTLLHRAGEWITNIYDRHGNVIVVLLTVVVFYLTARIEQAVEQFIYFQF